MVQVFHLSCITLKGTDINVTDIKCMHMCVSTQLSSVFSEVQYWFFNHWLISFHIPTSYFFYDAFPLQIIKSGLMTQADYEEVSRKALSLFEYGQVIKLLCLSCQFW